MKLHIKNRISKVLVTFMSSVLILGTLSTPAMAAGSKKAKNDTEKPVVSKVDTNGYRLDKVVVLSRHNVRAPLSTNGSILTQLTPHKWINWSAAGSELTSHGGVLETEMGQYYRKYLVKEHLFTENERPKNGVLFYANSMQRCIATAQYFSSGFLPVANSRIVYKNQFNTMDPVFSPQLTFVNPAFEKRVSTEISAMGGKKGFNGIEKNLEPDYKLMAKVLDLKKSKIAKEKGYTKFPTNDLKINFSVNKEPNCNGSSLQVANSASDALILQYYETPNATRAAFGHKLTYKQWEQLAHIKDVYGDVLFAAPSMAENVTHPLLQEIKHDLNDSDKFTFLCGHDSNICSVLAALDTKKYNLPYSIEKKTPIGGNILMEVWQNKKGQKFITMKYVYFSVRELRHLSDLDLKNPPMVYDLTLNGEKKNKDGMYHYNDVINRFDQSINAYNPLKDLK